jgi:pentapeptide MXKDX repeat protein
MKKLSLGLASVSMLSLIAASGALAQGMSHSYEVTVTNTMASELIAPVLTTGIDHDKAIFKGNYVTPEAEVQVLTGDPAKLAAAIGKDVTIAHGEDGPPGVLLAPGKSITFTVTTEAKEIRLFAMVAPTEKPDNYLTTTIALEPGMDKGMAKAMDKGMETAGMDKAMPASMMDDTVMIPEGGASLMAGDSDDRVVLLRKRLGVMADGNEMMFDEGLRSAVMDYQKAHGLSADGVVGPSTLASLNKKMMAKDTMAKDTMAKDTMAKDTMAKDSMAKDTMMKDGMLSAVLHRFDIGHDEKSMAITPVAGEFGTVSVKKL